jgi:HD-like signal output (HDOD) protein
MDQALIGNPAAFVEVYGGKHFRNPVLIEKTLGILRDPTCSAQSLVGLLEREPGISSKVLKAANSAFFGTPRTISSLKAAIVRVGNQNIARIALAAALTPTRSHLWVGFWRHSIAVSLLTKHIAQFVKTYSAVEEEEFLTMGLLHDMGILFMLMSGEYGAVDQWLAQEPCTLDAAEKKVFGFDHATLGLHIGQAWNFPSDLVHAMAYHHQPEQSREFYHRIILVHLADLIASGFQFGLNARELPPHSNEAYLEDVHLPVEQLVLFGEWLLLRKTEIDAFGDSMAG